MNGIKRAQNLYTAYVSALIDREFSQYAHRIAVGICGQGSDCWGYDDSVSKDHDNDTGLVLWLDDETYGEIGRALGEKYHDVLHVALDRRTCDHNPRKGVHTISGFYQQLVGGSEGPQTWEQWMSIPSHYLADATNGVVFRDDQGEFSRIRQHILYDMPEEVRLKKIAGRLALAAQSGQYNYARCLDHGEREAAEMALAQFVEHSLQLIYLLNFQHAPYYKWQFRHLREQGIMSDAVELLSRISLNQCDRVRTIEQFAAIIVSKLRQQGLTTTPSDYMEHHGQQIMDNITHPAIRALHLMHV